MSEMRTGRLWRFADCEFDEWTNILKVGGRPSDLDSKPLELLKYLVGFPGKTLTKFDLITAVWPGSTVEDSLTTAIYKLRRAIGGQREDVIKTIHGVGYRFVAPLECIVIEHRGASSSKLESGSPVPGDERCILGRPLGRAETTWLAEQTATKQVHVFQFATEEIGRECLSRELRAFQSLRAKFGQSAPQPPINDAQFENSPFFLQAEYGGPNLWQWSPLQTLTLTERLEVFTALASAVADVHEARLVHNDLRPENILVSPDPQTSHWRVRLIGFKFATARDSATPLDPLSPELQTVWKEKLNREVTYRADELRSGAAGPSPLTDIYALGVLLYQFICAELHERPSPGWELRIPDPSLRLDIAEAANGDPALRLKSARELARRTATIEQRRIEYQRQAELAERAEKAERAVAEDRARRPWQIAAAAVLCAGIIASLTYYERAKKEKNVAESMNGFVSEDMLGQDNPLQSRAGPNETLQEAIKNAIPEIDRRFGNEPDAAARLHEVVAAALQNRSQYKEAREQYEAAAHLYRRADGNASERAVSALLGEAHMDAISNVSGALSHAEAVLAQQVEALSTRGSVPPVLRIRLLATEAVVASQGKDMAKAWNSMQEAVALADKTPDLDPSLRSSLHQQVAYIDLRTGHVREMEQNAHSQIAEVRLKDGPDSPHLLIPELQLMEAYMLQQKNQEAVSLANELYPKFQHQLGTDNDLTLQILGTRAAAEGALEKWDDSIADELAAHETAVKRDPHSVFALGSLSDVAMNECRKGDWNKGESYARQVWSALRAENAPQPGLVTGTALNLASCILRFGDQTNQEKLTEAEKLLGEAQDTRYVAALTGNPGIAADFEFAKAQLAFARRDYSAAQKYVTAAEPSFNGPAADRYQTQALGRFKQKLITATDKKSSRASERPDYSKGMRRSMDRP